MPQTRQGYAYPFREMKVKNSFFIPLPKEQQGLPYRKRRQAVDQLRRKILANARWYRKRCKDEGAHVPLFTTRAVKQGTQEEAVYGVRCWRVV